MSSWLILVVALIYLVTSIDLAYNKQWTLALVFFSYSVSNIGLYFISKM